MALYDGEVRTCMMPLSTERFNETHIPLAAPTDPSWKFEDTTLFIDLQLRADQIGNLLLDFLESDSVVASITKAKREKYSVKYDGVVNNLMCTTKCRMYKQSTQYALEFQRRSGDTVVFNSLFRQAAEHLQKLGVNIVEGMPQLPLSTERFNETHVPPAAPTHPFWKFEVTTLFIDLQLRADQIGNLLLDFLESGSVVASITKAKREKYSVKYDGVVDNLMCTTKCRMYKQSTQYALEFQRRSGDTIVFNSLFRQAAKHLQKLGVNIVEGMPQSSLCGFKYLPPPPPLPMYEEECDDLGPIIDMSYIPELQAKSACFLASHIEEPSRASRL